MALKTLSSTGIANNNPILPGQVTQSVDAFTGAEGYAITVSGSFTFSGATTGSGYFSNAISASYSNITTSASYASASTSASYSLSASQAADAVTALNASKLNPLLVTTPANYNVLFASTSSATYEQVYREDGAVMIYNPSTDLLTVTSSYAVSSSRAISSSYSDNATVNQVNAQQYYNGVSVVNGDFKFVAGKTAMSSGAATSSIFTNLAGKTLGTNAWITANFQNLSGLISETVMVTSISSSGEILFDSSNLNPQVVIFTGIYI